jgi:glycosyltransferase involved in cell wall biosynthesis
VTSDVQPKVSGPRGPLRIAVMIESVLVGGAEMVVWNLVEELRGRGHTVHPVVPEGRGGWLIDRFEEAGVAWHTYDLRRPIDPGLPRRMADKLGALGVDVIHSHEFVTAFYGTAAARRLGVPHVITLHGNQTTTEKLQRRVALRWAMRNSSATVAVSTDTRRHLIETLGRKAEQVIVIPNGVPVRPGNRDATRASLGVDPEDVLILAVGTLVERKGHSILARALAQLPTDLPRWKAVVAGYGPERENLERLIRELDLEGRMELLGVRTDVPDLQAAADIFAMPSLWEGLPLAILEAMLADNPIIASGISGIPEAVESGTDGILVPPGEVEPLRAALEKLLRDGDLRRAMGQSAKRRALAHHTMAVMTDAYERLYRA